jgi:hypothetical protein
MLPVRFRATGPVTGPRNTGPELPVPATEASHAALTPSPYGGDGGQCPERRGRQAGSSVSRPCAA